MDAASLKTAFGQKVRELRERAGLSQRELGERIDRDDDTVGNIERGDASTRIETAQRIAQALGVALPELFEWNAAPSADRTRRRQVDQLAVRLTKLDDSSFADVARVVGGVLDMAERRNGND